MKTQNDISIPWIRTGAICGFAGIGAYAFAAFIPAPDFISYLAAFSFGPLLSIAIAGLYHLLAFHKKTPLLQVGTLLSMTGGITVLLMLCVQQSIFVSLKRIEEESTDDLYSKLSEGLNSVQLGLDVAWDVLIASGTVLIGISMLNHPRFGKIIGGIGSLLGLLLLGFNIYYFPTPPADANSIDWGPFVALWYGVVAVMMLLSVRWAQNIAEADRRD